MYNYNSIETFASWILDEIKKARSKHKKADMRFIKSLGKSIGVLAEQQEMCFEHNKIPTHGVSQF